MTDEEFDELAAKLEGFAKRSPGWYRLGAVGVALVGYGYLIGVAVAAVLLFVVSALAAFLAVAPYLLALCLPAAVVLWAVLKALRVRFALPDGVEIHREDAPRLFELVDELRGRLKAPTIHQLFLTGACNASAGQRPRLGFFGWHKNYIVLGVPLALALSREHLTAVLAHELGHISRRHGRLGAWIYRTRYSWSEFAGAIAARDDFTFEIFRGFMKWYSPIFSAYTLALARAQELEADRCAVDAVGSKTAGEALIGVELYGRLLDERFWKIIDRRLKDEPTAPPAIYRDLRDFLEQPPHASDRRRWLDEALCARTDSDDTHPALSERLRRIDAPAKVPAAPLKPALDELIEAPTIERALDALDETWRDANAEAWALGHQEARKAASELAEIEAKSQSTLLSPDEWFRRAVLVEQLRSPEEAFPLYETVLQQSPDHAAAQFQLGAHLIERGDLDGVAWVERAMYADHDLVMEGCEVLATAALRRGDYESLSKYRDWARHRALVLEWAEYEEQNLLLADSFVPNGLSDEELAALRKSLLQVPHLLEAYVVRKATVYSRVPIYVIGLVLQYHGRNLNDVAAEVVEAIELPGVRYALALNGAGFDFGPKMCPVEGARVY